MRFNRMGWCACWTNQIGLIAGRVGGFREKGGMPGQSIKRAVMAAYNNLCGFGGDEKPQITEIYIDQNEDLIKIRGLCDGSEKTKTYKCPEVSKYHKPSCV